jgi:hypothetical protein
MSTTEVHNASHDAAVGKADMHLEVEIIPVSDVDRAWYAAYLVAEQAGTDMPA